MVAPQAHTRLKCFSLGLDRDTSPSLGHVTMVSDMTRSLDFPTLFGEGALVLAVCALRTESVRSSIEAALRLLATIAATTDGGTVVWLLTVGGNASADQAMRWRPLHAGLWGLARSARVETPAARIGCIDLRDTDLANLVDTVSFLTRLNARH